MSESKNSIGVVVCEPNSELLLKLCSTVAQVWGEYEVLPRQTAKELHIAAAHLSIGLVIIRSSVHRSSTLIQAILSRLYSLGTQVLIIQDTAYAINEKHSVSFKNLHFLHNSLGENELEALLRLCLVRHCVPEELSTDF